MGFYMFLPLIRGASCTFCLTPGPPGPLTSPFQGPQGPLPSLNDTVDGWERQFWETDGWEVRRVSVVAWDDWTLTGTCRASKMVMFMEFPRFFPLEMVSFQSFSFFKMVILHSSST